MTSKVLLELADRVADLCTAWGDMVESEKRDAIANELRTAASGVEPIAYVVMAKDGSIGPKVAPTRWATFPQLMAEMEADDWVKHGHAKIVPLYLHPGAEARDAWLPIESAPRDGTIILASVGGKVLLAVWDRWVDPYLDRKPIGWTEYRNPLGLTSFCPLPINPTGWQPLPPPADDAALRAREAGS